LSKAAWRSASRRTIIAVRTSEYGHKGATPPSPARPIPESVRSVKTARIGSSKKPLPG
jgi:hypothetical protein